MSAAAKLTLFTAQNSSFLLNTGQAHFHQIENDLYSLRFDLMRLSMVEKSAEALMCTRLAVNSVYRNKKKPRYCGPIVN